MLLKSIIISSVKSSCTYQQTLGNRGQTGLPEGRGWGRWWEKVKGNTVSNIVIIWHTDRQLLDLVW